MGKAKDFSDPILDGYQIYERRLENGLVFGGKVTVASCCPRRGDGRKR